MAYRGRGDASAARGAKRGIGTPLPRFAAPPGTLLRKPSNDPRINGPVKILQSRRNESVESEVKPGPIPPTTPTVPRIASRTESRPQGLTIGAPSFSIKPKTDLEEKQQQNSIVTLPPVMSNSIRLFEEVGNGISRNFMEFLGHANTKFHIVAVVGPQSSGKSTFASMLAGNEPNDMYGEYVFRASPREFIEKGFSHTTSIQIYVTKYRTIILDCQAINSGYILESTIRSNRKESMKHVNAMKAMEEETQRMLLFLLEICHTVILAVDWFIDLNIVRELMLSQVLLQKSKSASGMSPRKVNLVLAQLRAKAYDFNPAVVAERVKVLRGIFEGSIFSFTGGVSMANLGLTGFSAVDPKVNYVIFSEIKPRPKADSFVVLDENFATYAVPFGDTMKPFRLQLLTLTRLEFEGFQTTKVSERDWFQNIVIPIWDKLAISEYTSFRK